jgi:hypothetical protein
MQFPVSRSEKASLVAFTVVTGNGLQGIGMGTRRQKYMTMKGII